MLLVALEKNRKGHVEQVARELAGHSAFSRIKMILVLEHTVDVSDIADAVWRFSNNIDPRRDHYIIKSSSPGHDNTIVFDGTRKTKELDGFEREWPNILASDETTIDRVDAIWPQLGLGKFIPSPSRKYRKQLYEGGAVAK
jgi:4-hydroxy-3-polyprenylbenzoate decarboxylase